MPGNPSRRANQQFYVSVPNGAKEGAEFPVLAGGFQLMVKTPEGCKAGDRIVVSAPSKRNTESFLATVPNGVNPGDQFPVLVGTAPSTPCPLVGRRNG